MAPRIQLARLMAEEGDLETAVELAATFASNGEGTVFVHDALFHAGRHPMLARLALRGLPEEPARAGVWMMALKPGYCFAARPSARRWRRFGLRPVWILNSSLVARRSRRG